MFVRGSVLALTLAGLSVAGCVDARLTEYRNHPTPELGTLGDTHAQIDNRSAELVDTNLSLLLEDLARLALWDRPSRLTKKPSPR